MAPSHSVAIYGAGAVGCYLGGLLSRIPNGPEVALIGRDRVAEAIRARGLILRNGDQEVTYPRAVTSIDGLLSPNLTLLTVRTFDVEAAIPDLRTLLGDDGVLLAFQNGVGTEEILAEALGRNRVLIGTLTVRVTMTEPGVVTRDSERGGVAVAAMTGSSVADSVLETLDLTGLPVTVVEDYRSLRWSKLLLNMLGASTSAILDMDLSDLLAEPSVFRAEQLALREAGRVMDRSGIRTVHLPGFPVPLVRRLMRLPRLPAQRLLAPRVAGARGRHSPGMRADLARGKTEIEAYNGGVVRQGKRLGVTTPVNIALADLVRDVTVDAERREELRHRPDRLVDALRSRGVRI